MTNHAAPRTEAGRDRRSITERIAEYQRDLDELRAAMRAREALPRDSPEFAAALAREDELLERIHAWAFGTVGDRHQPNRP